MSDVSDLIKFNDLRDVILVGHSYGGMVITGAAARVPDRVSQMIYLDAVVPRSGECHFDICDAERRQELEQLIATDGRGRVVPGRGSGLAYFGIREPSDVSWVRARLSDQPAATFTQPLGDVSAAEPIPKTYLRFSRSNLVSKVSDQRARLLDYRVLDLPHDAMVSHPEVLARELIGIAAELAETTRTGKEEPR